MRSYDSSIGMPSPVRHMYAFVESFPSVHLSLTNRWINNQASVFNVPRSLRIFHCLNLSKISNTFLVNYFLAMPEPRRIAQIVKLRPEALQAYKECHAAVWPAVLEQIKDCNISDYSIFFDDASSTLFASMKWNGQDFEADMKRMSANPEVQRWWKMTDGTSCLSKSWYSHNADRQI